MGVELHYAKIMQLSSAFKLIASLADQRDKKSVLTGRWRHAQSPAIRHRYEFLQIHPASNSAQSANANPRAQDIAQPSTSGNHAHANPA